MVLQLQKTAINMQIEQNLETIKKTGVSGEQALRILLLHHSLKFIKPKQKHFTGEKQYKDKVVKKHAKVCDISIEQAEEDLNYLINLTT